MRSTSCCCRRRLCSCRGKQHRGGALLARALGDELPSLAVPQAPGSPLEARERPRQGSGEQFRARACRDRGRRPRGERGEARGRAALPEPRVPRDAAARSLLALPGLLLLLPNKRAALRQVVEAAEVVEGEDVGRAVGLVGRACGIFLLLLRRIER